MLNHASEQQYFEAIQKVQRRLRFRGFAIETFGNVTLEAEYTDNFGIFLDLSCRDSLNTNVTKIWFDVTDIAKWRGNLTGIQRTVFKLGELFGKQENVHFFEFNDSKEFVEVEFPSHPQSSVAAAPIHSQNFYKLVIRKLSSAIFRALRKLISTVGPRRGRQFFKAVIWRIREFRADFRFLRGVNRHLNVSYNHPFSEGDVVLIFGASWGQPDLNDALLSLRRNLDFKLLVMVYDLIPIYFPHFFGPNFAPHYANHIMDLLHRADGLISISKNTSNDLRKFSSEVHAPLVPIFQLRLGDDHETLDVEPKPLDWLSGLDFVLVVGTVEIRKNHLALYQVWSLAYDRKIKLPKLIIVGANGWLASDFAHLVSNDPRVRGEIHHLHGIDDATLDWLYRNCLFTVYPSWYEGWGLPVAESLKYGKVCISSDTSSMPEIGGDLVQYVRPSDTEKLFASILELSENSNLRAELEHEISTKYEITTWEDSFRMMWSEIEKEIIF